MTEAATVPYQSRRGGLIFFGIVELLMGLLCLLFLVMMIMAMFFVAAHAGTAQTPPPRQMMGGVLMYLFGGVLLITLGIGSMQCRRWARDLSLVVAWLWFLLGLMGMAAMAFMLPRIIAATPSAQPGLNTIVFTCMMVFFGLFGVVVPLAMILFYRSSHVRATCQARDPQPRWTERVPLPLLGLSVWLVTSAVSMIVISAYAVLPLRNHIITGPAAVVAYCAIGLFLLYLAWGVYVRSLAAWWAGVAYGILALVYFFAVYPFVDYNAVIKAMNLQQPPSAPDMSGIYHSPAFLASMVLLWVIYFGYFLFVRRYFRPSVPGATAA